MNATGYQAYKEQSVFTMTQGELLLILYDELLKRLTRAELSLEQADYQTFEQSVERSSQIVEYLNATLNHSIPISAELSRMYDFFKVHLARIQASRDSSKIAELKPLVKDLREAFAEAEKK